LRLPEGRHVWLPRLLRAPEERAQSGPRSEADRQRAVGGRTTADRGEAGPGHRQHRRDRRAQRRRPRALSLRQHRLDVQDRPILPEPAARARRRARDISRHAEGMGPLQAGMTADSPSQPEERRPPLLRLRGISKRFGPVVAVAPLDLSIRSGDFYAILGPSGCGKTTLLRVIGGVPPPPTARPPMRGKGATPPAPPPPPP